MCLEKIEGSKIPENILTYVDVGKLRLTHRYKSLANIVRP